MSGKSLKLKGLTRRWTLNVLSVFFVIIMIVEVVMIVVINDFYFSSVEQYLQRKIDNVTLFFNNYSSQSTDDFFAGAREYIEAFDERDSMEVQILNSHGELVMTTNGFAPSGDTDSQGFKSALDSAENYALFRGKSASGESIMSATAIIGRKDNSTSPVGAISIRVSIEDVEAQLLFVILSVLTVGIVLFSVVLLSGFYFIRSIINPVRSISETARQIAMGDFDARIDRVYKDDEVGELCDIINYMAGELASTEKLKNEFISSVSHELRTPLTAIKGWGETVMQSTDDKELTQKGMEVIIGEAERLSVIVEDLLDFSRMQNGQISYNMQTCDVVAELSEAVLTLTDTANRQDITIDYTEPESDIPTITGDPIRLQQVFVNIIDNAIKYTPAGGSIVVSVELINNNIVTMISDTGKGIPADDIPKIKQKFYKAKNSTRGSGIGLAICDEIVTHHGGKLEINSTVDVGTSVSISLPVSSEEK